MKLASIVVAPAALALTAGVAAAADTVRFASYLEPSHIVTRKLHTGRVNADNIGFEVELFTGGALMPAMGALDGIASGVVDIGVIAAA